MIVAAIGAFGYVTRLNISHWMNDGELWSHAVRVNPSSPIAHETLGNTFRQHGDPLSVGRQLCFGQRRHAEKIRYWYDLLLPAGDNL